MPGTHFVRSNGSTLSWETAHDIASLARTHDANHTNGLRFKIAQRIQQMLDAPTRSAALNEARTIARKLDAIEQRRKRAA